MIEFDSKIYNILISFDNNYLQDFFNLKSMSNISEHRITEFINSNVDLIVRKVEKKNI